MRTTGPKSVAVVFPLFGFTLLTLMAAVTLTAADEPVFPVVVANLASALSRGDAVAAMESFDSKSKDYASIETALGALIAQTEILCAIDIVEEKDSGDVHLLDVDWYVQLKSKEPAGPTERRRERVTLGLSKLRGKWRIVSLSPLSVLSPLSIR